MVKLFARLDYPARREALEVDASPQSTATVGELKILAASLLQVSPSQLKFYLSSFGQDVVSLGPQDPDVQNEDKLSSLPLRACATLLCSNNQKPRPALPSLLITPAHASGTAPVAPGGEAKQGGPALLSSDVGPTGLGVFAAAVGATSSPASTGNPLFPILSPFALALNEFSSAAVSSTSPSAASSSSSSVSPFSSLVSLVAPIEFDQQPGRALPEPTKWEGLTTENCLDKLLICAKQGASFEPRKQQIQEYVDLNCLKSDRLCASEAQLFQAVLAWGKAQLAEQTQEAGGQTGKTDTAKLKEVVQKPLTQIRFATMTTKEIAKVVSPSGMIDMSEQLALFTYLGSKDATLPASLAKYNAKPRERLAVLSFDPETSQGVLLSEDNQVAEWGSKDAAAYGKHGFKEGVWEWKVTVLKCRGNYMDIGVTSARDQRSSLRVTGLHAGGSSVQIQQGCGVKRHNYKRGWERFDSGVMLTVRLDMNARTLSYNVNGQDLGIVVQGLPDGPIYPAIDFRTQGIQAKIHDLQRLRST
eukprot:g71698.t1